MYLHLDRLKARILPPELAGQTRYDDRLAPMAEGVARAFDAYAGRALARAVSSVESHPGGRQTYSLSTYPVESVAAATLVHPDESETEIEIARVNWGAGLVHFAAPAGGALDELRLTVTGGYWVDLSEDGDGSKPSGAAAMPADLVDAWCLQCDHEARLRKIFGGAKAEDVGKAYDPGDHDLLPRVVRVLRAYARIC